MLPLPVPQAPVAMDSCGWHLALAFAPLEIKLLRCAPPALPPHCPGWLQQTAAAHPCFAAAHLASRSAPDWGQSSAHARALGCRLLC